MADAPPSSGEPPVSVLPDEELRAALAEIEAPPASEAGGSSDVPVPGAAENPHGGPGLDAGHSEPPRPPQAEAHVPHAQGIALPTGEPAPTSPADIPAPPATAAAADSRHRGFVRDLLAACGHGLAGVLGSLWGLVDPMIDLLNAPLRRAGPRVEAWIGWWAIATLAVSLLVLLSRPLVPRRATALEFLEQRRAALRAPPPAAVPSHGAYRAAEEHEDAKGGAEGTGH